MKKWIGLALIALSIMEVNGQTKIGTVIYERKINMHKTISMLDPQMKAMIPEFRTSKHILLFNENISVYKMMPEDEAPDPFGGGGGMRMVFRGGPDAGETYKDFSINKAIQSSEISGKNFLITDTIKQEPWKIGTETKEILGYTCKKASRKMPSMTSGVTRVITSLNSSTVKDSSKSMPNTPPKEVEVVAWFAENLISPAGPDNFGQLPGVILALDIDNGTTAYTALEILKSADAKEMKEPKKGKIVTRQEYQKMMMELMGGGMPGMTKAIRIN